MKRIPEDNSSSRTSDRLPVPGAQELEGWADIGKKSEALAMARRKLKASPVRAKEFNDALRVILIHAYRLKVWTPLVGSAYERLPKRELPCVRFSMVSFRACCRDHEGVLQLMPKRFVGEDAPSELAFVLEAAFALDRKELARKLAKRLHRAIQVANQPVAQAQLLLCLSELRARQGKWDEAIAAAEAAQNCETFDRDAVVRIVEIHLARALRALEHGLQLTEQFKKNFDPKVELMLPGNDDAVQKQAAKQFRRLQKILERIVPKERQKELGID